MSFEIKNFPAQHGFFMPAEWAVHGATWITWPCDDCSWSGSLEAVRQEFATFIQTILKFEPVHILVRDEQALHSAKQLLGTPLHLHFFHVPTNDSWLRDNGPTFVTNGYCLGMINWDFNGWGQKFPWSLDNQVPVELGLQLKTDFFSPKIVMEGGAFDVNGQGALLTTKQCLRNAFRNPLLSQNDIEVCLKNYLGVQKIFWLEGGLEGDHTDGHIDTIARFVDKETIVYCTTLETDSQDVNAQMLQKNFALLKSFQNINGEPFRLCPLLLPKNKMYLEGKPLPCTYANFYIGNGFVIVPLYDDPHDSLALSTLTSVFPHHTVLGRSSKEIIKGGGSFHCITQQQPAGNVFWQKGLLP